MLAAFAGGAHLQKHGNDKERQTERRQRRGADKRNQRPVRVIAVAGKIQQQKHHKGECPGGEQRAAQRRQRVTVQ